MANRYSTQYVRVEGAEALQAALRNMAKEAQTSVIMGGVIEAVKPIQRAMIVKCPVRTDKVRVGGKKLAPGEMRASIRAKVVGYPNSGHAIGLIGPSGRAGRVAHLVEYGHLTTSSKKGQTVRRGNARAAATGRTHVPAHPFIRRAVLTTIGEQRSAFLRGITTPYLNSVKSS